MKTHETERLGGWVRRFLIEHLVVERNLSRNTQRSYRDTFRLLVPFATGVHKTTVEHLAVLEVSADLVRRFCGTSRSTVCAACGRAISGSLPSTRSRPSSGSAARS